MPAFTTDSLPKPIYKFYLDENLLQTDPRGWDDITFFVKLDKDLNGLLTFIDAELEFFDDGYTYLTDKLYSEGFCTIVELKILQYCQDGDYRQIHKGLLKLSKLFIDERICSAKIKPDDNSFYARIDKNRSLSTFPWIEQSKNGTTITPAVLSPLGFFRPSTGVYYAIPGDYASTGYRVYEILRHLIAYMTDDEVEFDSTLFGIGGEFEGMMITSGTVLFTVQSTLNEAVFKDTFPELSFEDAFRELKKKFNIGFYFDYSGSKPKIWIERAQDIPTGVVSTTMDGISKIKTSVDIQRLFNTLRIGSTTIQDVPAPALQFPESIDWLGFKEETYNILGDCGVDTELDLVSDWIISSNVIEDAVVSPSSAYEGKIALVSARPYSGLTYVANQTNDLTATPPYYYNQDLTNSAVASRFYGYVPSSIAKFLGNNDNTFFATKTANGAFTHTGITPTNYGPITFEDDFNSPNADPSNNFVNTDTFICPQSGAYTLSTTLRIQMQVSNVSSAKQQIYFSVYDATDTFLYSNYSIEWTVGHLTPNPVIRTHSATFFLTAGQKVKVFYTQKRGFGLDSAFTILLGSTYSCTSDVTGAGIYQTNDPKDYLGLIHEFEYPISESMWQLIKNNPRGSIEFAQADQSFRVARIDTIQFNKTGISQVKLIRSINT